VKDKNVLKYLNRLSDALFVVGRWVGVKNGEIEEVWKG
jgi:cob(I)alamin adenosyltransferase